MLHFSDVACFCFLFCFVQSFLYSPRWIIGPSLVSGLPITQQSRVLTAKQAQLLNNFVSLLWFFALLLSSCVPLEYHHHEFWDQNNNMGNSINKVIITVRNSLAQSQIESPTNIFKIPQYFTGGIRLLFINTSTKCRPSVRVPQATWGGEQQERRRMSLHNQHTINLHSYWVTG